MNYSSSRSYSIRRPLERKHPTQNGLCIEWANTTKTKLPMRRIAAPNDNGVTPSRLHRPLSRFDVHQVVKARIDLFCDLSEPGDRRV